MQKELEGVMTTFPDDMPEEEAALYAKHAAVKYGAHLKGLEIKIDEDDAKDVLLYYDVDPMPFQRLRRITGKPAK